MLTMAGDTTFADYSEFSSYLLGLCRQSKNGTIFLTSADNVAGMVSLQNGIVVGVSCRTTKGSAALELLPAVMQKCKFRFTERLIMQTDTDLPGEAQTLQALGLSSNDAEIMLAERIAASMFPRNPDARSPVLRIENRTFKSIIERTAAEIFGPIGQIICGNHLEKIDKIKTLDDLRWLLRIISDEIGDTELRKQFFSSVLQQLGLDTRRDKRD